MHRWGGGVQCEPATVGGGGTHGDGTRERDPGSKVSLENNASRLNIEKREFMHARKVVGTHQY